MTRNSIRQSSGRTPGGGKRQRWWRLRVVVLAALLAVGIVCAPTSSFAGSTYAETVGGLAHTWTNPSNAGGTEGPVIQSGSTVQIACVVQGFRVQDGNTNWYRIDQSPWSNQYYVSADAFYNNGATSGSLSNTPFVDNAVPDCAGSPGGSAGGPKPAPTVSLTEGASAQSGYWYAISAKNFAPNTSVTVTCYDSVTPSGFYPKMVATDANGSYSNTKYCFSGDGPDHWVIVSEVQSNHVTWSGGNVSGGGGSTTPPTTPPSSTPRPTATLVVPTTPAKDIPLAKSPRTLFAPPGWNLVVASCAALKARLWGTAATYCYHYVDDTGTSMAFNMKSMIDTQPAFRSMLNSSLQTRVKEVYSTLRSIPSSGSYALSLPAPTVWDSANAVGEWAEVVHAFDYSIFGDMWIGPANAQGVRALQLRYRLRIADIYDFNSSHIDQRIFALAADWGWAAKFGVYSMMSFTRVINTDTSQFNPGIIAFEYS